jgi:hypothetical protein
METGSRDPFIIFLHYGWRKLITITPRPLFLSEMDHCKNLKRFVGPRTSLGIFEEKKSLLLLPTIRHLFIL